MSDLARSPGNRPSRRTREQRAYRLAMIGGGSGIVATAGFLLAIFGVIGFGIPFLAAVVAVICYLLFRRTVS